MHKWIDEVFLQGCDVAKYKGSEKTLDFTSALKHSGKYKCWNDHTGYYYKVIKYRKYCFMLSPKLNNCWMILQTLLFLLCHGWAAKPKWAVAIWDGWDCWLMPFALQTEFSSFFSFWIDTSNFISLLPQLSSHINTKSWLALPLPILSIYSPQAQLSWDCASIQPFNWSFQNLATCKIFQKMKSWCATGESRHEMQVGLMDWFYFELIEIFQNSYFWQDFKWKSFPHFLLSLLSPSHTMVFNVINM